MKMTKVTMQVIVREKMGSRTLLLRVRGLHTSIRVRTIGDDLSLFWFGLDWSRSTTVRHHIIIENRACDEVSRRWVHNLDNSPFSR